MKAIKKWLINWIWKGNPWCVIGDNIDKICEEISSGKADENGFDLNFNYGFYRVTVTERRPTDKEIEELWDNEDAPPFSKKKTKRMLNKIHKGLT